MNLDRELEAILYYKNEPMTPARLASIVGREESDVRAALVVLDERLKTSGLVLISSDDQYTLGTSPEFSPLIEKMVKDDMARDLGKASLDTLTIILYYGPVAKAQIDNIRGVNSGSMLRNLLIRGLISRDVNPEDQRSYTYKPTLELLSYLGIKNINELPEYNELRQTLDGNLTDISKNNNESTGT